MTGERTATMPPTSRGLPTVERTAPARLSRRRFLAGAGVAGAAGLALPALSPAWPSPRLS